MRLSCTTVWCPDQVTYMIWVELAVPRQTVKKPLDVRSKDVVTSCIIDLVEMFSETVPEVEGDLHHLGQKMD